LVNLLPPRGAEDEVIEGQVKEAEEAPLDDEEVLELDVESPKTPRFWANVIDKVHILYIIHLK